MRLANRTIIGVALFITSLVIAALVKKFVSSGLLPLEQLADQVSQLDARSLDRRIVHRGVLKRELATIEVQLNRLLDRLEAGFRREKRFSSDVAHELRTPLAELRTLAEVGRQQPDDRETVLRFFRDVEDVSVQMTNLVDILLDIARSETGCVEIYKEEIELASFVDGIWSDLQRVKPEYRKITNEIPVDIRVYTDREILRLIISNLLLNADDYSTHESDIRVTAFNREQHVDVRFNNHTTDLDEVDIPDMMQRFWRKDRSRTGTGHSGLGLALVEAMAATLGFHIEMSFEADGWFQVSVEHIPESSMQLR